MRSGSVLSTFVVLLAMPSLLHAEDRLVELGGGVSFDALGSYDVGHALGLAGTGEDLGPATLGMLLGMGLRPTDALTVSVRGEVAVGGLVGTDERYWGSHETVGSTLTVRAGAGADYRVLERGRLRLSVGGQALVERLSESTGLGFVHVDALALGPILVLGWGPSFRVQLQPLLHLPWAAEIQNRASGQPGGMFVSGGLQLLWFGGLGTRS